MSAELLLQGENVTDQAKTGDLLTDFFGRSVVALELAAESREFM